MREGRFLVFFGVKIPIKPLLEKEELVIKQYKDFVDPCEQTVWRENFDSLPLNDKLANYLAFISRNYFGQHAGWFLATEEKITHFCLSFANYSDDLTLEEVPLFVKDVQNIPSRFVDSFNRKLFWWLEFLGKDFAETQICKAYILTPWLDKKWVECNEKGERVEVN